MVALIHAKQETMVLSDGKALRAYSSLFTQRQTQAAVAARFIEKCATLKGADPRSCRSRCSCEFCRAGRVGGSAWGRVRSGRGG